MFKEVYVRPGDELTEQLHSTMVEKGQITLEYVASQLPLKTPVEEVFPPEDAWFQIMIDTLDQTLGRRHGNVRRGLGKARLWDPSASSSRQRTEKVQMLTFKVVGLKEQIAAQNNLMNQIRRALQISGIHFPDVEPPPETISQPPTHPPPLLLQQLRPPGPTTQQQHHQAVIVTSRTTFFSFVLNCFQI